MAISTSVQTATSIRRGNAIKKYKRETGIAQGDKHHMYLIDFFADLYYELKHDELVVTFYADDLGLGKNSHCYLQPSLNNFELYGSRQYFKVNIADKSCQIQKRRWTSKN